MCSFFSGTKITISDFPMVTHFGHKEFRHVIGYLPIFRVDTRKVTQEMVCLGAYKKTDL